ncbi:hypothetical protein BY996DRAFT_6430154 [Phakopsora pachyrhizi]|uniref:DNA repair protein rhp7 treble clef domain-containing protein n=1 Tax=Phakopsora pachyrhizi TaxID=170000 RepID=A0AAV0BPB3_PHAPC|nr:hypothetical protein BY996DRAFT_6430154 [Phakopsora pachyrhizi]CAH7688019.1 hypothetical protein PPACK8108_LOCUS22911 [Phakopsora pachyrhizi]
MVRPSRFNNTISPSARLINDNSNQTGRTFENDDQRSESVGMLENEQNHVNNLPTDDLQPHQANLTTTSNNTGNHNQITGPTSALTSFLKEQGIRPRNTNRFARRQPHQSTSTSVQLDFNPIDELQEGQEEEEEEEEEEEVASDEIDSDDLDGITSKKKLSKGKTSNNPTPLTTTNNSHQPQQASSSRQSTKKPAPTSPPGSPPVGRPAKYADRKPGHIATCVECGKRFTVTRYTPNSNHHQGQLCEECADDPLITKPDERKSLEVPRKRRKVLKKHSFKSVAVENSVKTLQMACIDVIARNIESIEALDNVGSLNLDKICQIVCKHRELRPVNLPLFLKTSHSELRLYDCIHLQRDHLLSISAFCPRLERLVLNLCGHLDGEVLLNYAQKLYGLIELDLFGAYLVRREAWLEAFKIWNTPRLVKIRKNGLDDYFDDQEGVDEDEEEVEIHQGPKMTKFRLKQSPRFDVDCLKALVDTCPNMVNLRLDDIGLLDDKMLDMISAAGLKNLESLSISNAGISNGATGESLTDQAVIRLLKSVGQSLEVLDISQNRNLTDSVLSEGIGSCCRRLRSLSISGLKEVNTEAVSHMFREFKRAEANSLESLDMSRCIRIGNEGLFEILEHSGKTLKYLNLNSVDEIREEGLQRLSKEANQMVELDVSFVRDVDDFVIKAFIEGMPKLKKLMVFGNNRISDLCPGRRGLTITGQERAIVVE